MLRALVVLALLVPLALPIRAEHLTDPGSAHPIASGHEVHLADPADWAFFALSTLVAALCARLWILGRRAAIALAHTERIPEMLDAIVAVSRSQARSVVFLKHSFRLHLETADPRHDGTVRTIQADLSEELSEVDQ